MVFILLAIRQSNEKITWNICLIDKKKINVVNTLVLDICLFI